MTGDEYGRLMKW